MATQAVDKVVLDGKNVPTVAFDAFLQMFAEKGYKNVQQLTPEDLGDVLGDVLVQVDWIAIALAAYKNQRYQARCAMMLALERVGVAATQVGAALEKMTADDLGEEAKDDLEKDAAAALDALDNELDNLPDEKIPGQHWGGRFRRIHAAFLRQSSLSGSESAPDDANPWAYELGATHSEPRKGKRPRVESSEQGKAPTAATERSRKTHQFGDLHSLEAPQNRANVKNRTMQRGSASPDFDLPDLYR